MTATWGITKGDLFLMDSQQAKKVWLWQNSNERTEGHSMVSARIVERDTNNNELAVRRDFYIFEGDVVSFLITKPRAWKKGSLHIFHEQPFDYDPTTYVLLPRKPKPLHEHYHYGLLSVHTKNVENAFYAYVRNGQLDYFLLQRKNGGG